ncbi:phage portal protein, partial [bacterium]|nr:phage portal protein [bacterium]
MQDTSSIIALMKQNAEKVNGEIIGQIVKDGTAERDRRLKLYKQYKQSSDTVAIYKRPFDDENKINRKLPNDFFGDIVDTKVGYLAGKPITYQLDKNPYMEEEVLSEERYDKDIEVVNDFLKYNTIAEVDSETFKYSAICGIGGRLLYVDTTGKAKIMNLKP